ncbi:MAG: sulfatase [Candidatus Aminicenantes bacterium]|jgi:arylsulfatase A-like enzyme
MSKNGILFVIVMIILSAFFVIWRLGSKHPTPNVILISIDTLRADHLGCYGYERETSPHLDDLAGESVLFKNFFSPSSATKPSHVSMLTSLYPLSHGVLSNRVDRAYSEDILSLAQILKTNGFMTAGFTGGGGVSEINGFRRGFDFWSEGHYIATHLPDVKDWILNNKDHKFFVFFHFYDVHDPYIFREDFQEFYRDIDFYKEFLSRAERKIDLDRVTFDAYNSLSAQEKIDSLVLRMLQRPAVNFEKGLGVIARNEVFQLIREWHSYPEYRKKLRMMVDSYDAGIKYTDHHLGHFFDFLKSCGLWENTLLIVTSDHGEEFMEHKMVGHLLNLYETLLHVPLILKMPRSQDLAGRQILGLADIVDIMPTTLDVLRISFKGQMQGQSLMPMLKGTNTQTKRAVFASIDNRYNEEKRSVRTQSWKYIIFDGDLSEKDEFFDLNGDAFEQNNLLAENERDISKLQQYLIDHMRDCTGIYALRYSKNRKKASDFSEEAQKRHLEIMRALGYIH